MNLSEKILRAKFVHDLSDVFANVGFKTEARLMKIQSDAVIKLVTKALDEMPKVEMSDLVAKVLGGGKVSVAHRAERHLRGKHYQNIGRAEKVMLKSVKAAFDNLFNSHYGWTGRKKLDATSRMMRTLMGKPKTESQSLLVAAKKQVRAQLKN